MVTRAVSMTMRTPGADAELALGYLYNEGVLKSFRDLADEVSMPNTNQVIVPFLHLPELPESRNLTTASCGICSSTNLQTFLNHEIHQLPLPKAPQFSIDFLYTLPDLLLLHQKSFSETGGLHAAALIDSEEGILTLQEDIGRHNAVDKVAGFLFKHHQLPAKENQLLLVSSRISYEIVQKALKMRIPTLVGLGPASSLAIDFANQAKLTLIGFLSEKKFNIYSTPERIHIQDQSSG
jgi:FdhD protein